MAFKVPLSMQLLGLKANTVLCAITPVYRGGVLVEQAVFYKEGFPVAKYESIEKLTAASATLKWVSDPWNGKLDVVKHPTFMEEAIQKHPDYAGDCDDFAAYWCVALCKNKLADEQWFSYALWVDDKKEITGHAVCVFRTGDKWFYAGNWNNSVPIPVVSRDAWVKDIEQRVSKKVVAAAMYSASGAKDDTMVLGGRSIVVRY